MVTNFYVIREENGKFKPYDVIPYLKNQYKETKKDRPKTLEEFKDFIKRWSRYMWWARCEYEIILSDWPCEKNQEKWDIHKQVMMNLDIIAEILKNSVSSK